MSSVTQPRSSHCFPRTQHTKEGSARFLSEEWPGWEKATPVSGEMADTGEINTQRMCEAAVGQGVATNSKVQTHADQIAHDAGRPWFRNNSNKAQQSH